MEIARRRWLPVHASTPDAGTAQSLTTSFVTLGAQFQVAEAGQLSLKMRHTATAAGQTLTLRVAVSDDPIETAEADSVWHTVGAQNNASGALTEEGWEYAGTASTAAATTGLVPLNFPVVAKKARVQVKGSAALGTALATVAFLPLI